MNDTVLQEKILKLLGNGLNPSVVAGAVGCTPALVSQLLAQPEFALRVAELRCKDVEEDMVRDNKYDDLEDKLLAKLENVLAFMTKPRDILEALKMVNGAKRRAQVGTAPEAGKTTHIHLHLPAAVIPKFSLSQNNEVIEVGGRVLANMPAATLMKSLELKEAERAENERPAAPPLKLGFKQTERAISAQDV